MLQIVLLGLLIIIPMVFCIYQYIIIRIILTKMRERLTRNSAKTKHTYELLQAIEKKIDAQTALLSNLDKQAPYLSGSKDTIESQYERAKRILSNDLVESHEQRDILNSCNMTAEEIELLTDLIGSEAEQGLYAND